jgi:hypothetical protein
MSSCTFILRARAAGQAPLEATAGSPPYFTREKNPLQNMRTLVVEQIKAALATC